MLDENAPTCWRRLVLPTAVLIRIGMDISADMLDVALERETEGELLLGDLGQASRSLGPPPPGTLAAATLMSPCFEQHRRELRLQAAARCPAASQHCLQG